MCAFLLNARKTYLVDATFLFLQLHLLKHVSKNVRYDFLCTHMTNVLIILLIINAFHQLQINTPHCGIGIVITGNGVLSLC